MLKKFGPLSVSVVRKYLQQVLLGLNYLHSNLIIHRDIKGGNILVDDRGNVKLADFGASKMLNMEGSLNGAMDATMKGTPYFMAPEVYEGKYGRKADIWSMGGVALQMITGESPWKSLKFSSPMALFVYVKTTKDPPPMDKNIPASLRSLITKCFQRNPGNRPSAFDVLKNSFFLEDDSDDDECDNFSIVSETYMYDRCSTALDCHVTPRTPSVDVRSASKRAILRSQKKNKALLGRREEPYNESRSLFSPSDELCANKRLQLKVRTKRSIEGVSNRPVRDDFAKSSPTSSSGHASNHDKLSNSKQHMTVQIETSGDVISPLSSNGDFGVQEYQKPITVEAQDDWPSWVKRATTSNDSDPFLPDMSKNTMASPTNSDKAIQSRFFSGTPCYPINAASMAMPEPKSPSHDIVAKVIHEVTVADKTPRRGSRYEVSGNLQSSC